MSAWLLPDHIADALPAEARHVELLRQRLLGVAASFGYELVMPPLLEYLQSLLTGSGEALNLQTFKLVDQLSGRTLGLRADMTQQVARIDAHLLNRTGVTRLCYAGPIAYTQPPHARALREALQFGAEIYGHAGLEADLEILDLAVHALRCAGVRDLTLDLADVRIVRALLDGLNLSAQETADVHAALAAKDEGRLHALTATFPAAARDGLRALPQLYGDASVLEHAYSALAATPAALPVLAHLHTLAEALEAKNQSVNTPICAQPRADKTPLWAEVDAASDSRTQCCVDERVNVRFDLSDLRGHAYYSGTRFGLYVRGVSDAIARGGRYDEVGAAYGRNRPAAGFSLDLRQLAAVLPLPVPRQAIRAPWPAGDATLERTIANLRASGEVVICDLPGHDEESAMADRTTHDEAETLSRTRALLRQGNDWVVKDI